jgi:uncharacterized protein
VTANPWLIPITTLRRNPGSRRHEQRAGRIGELSVAGSVVPADAEVSADAVLDSVGGGIEVSAELRAPWQGECRRCLRALSGELHCDVRELYTPRRAGESDDADEETYPLSGETLDLRPLVRDALLLELPIAPVCQADCRGLCPTCGADLNEGPCACEPASDPRWAALDVLRELGEGR